MGKFGISFKFLAILSFVLAFFVSAEILLLVVAFCVVAEKDAWLIRQSLQALLLKLSVLIVTNVIGWFFAAIFWSAGSLFRVRDISAIIGVNSFLIGLVWVTFFAFAFWAVLNLLKGKDANVPLISKLVEHAMSKSVDKKHKVEDADNLNQRNSENNSVNKVQNKEGVIQDRVEIKNNGNSTNKINISQNQDKWICECDKENKGKFCVYCGKPRIN